MTRYFDTHAHLADPRFDEDRELIIGEKLPASGVSLVCEVVCDLRTAEKGISVIRENERIYGAVGMHPHYADAMDGSAMDALSALLTGERIVALGEIGLDYHYDFSPRETQKKWFDEQLCLAEQLSLPVVLHIREAMGDCMDILRAHRAALAANGGIMHCFSGSVETARECLELGLMIGMGGSLTFKNARKLVEVAEFVPMEHIVLETDCPYMTPVPHRGERNDPSFLPLVAQRLGEIKGIAPDEVAEQAFLNGCRVYGIDNK